MTRIVFPPHLLLYLEVFYSHGPVVVIFGASLVGLLANLGGFVLLVEYIQVLMFLILVSVHVKLHHL